jgi:thioredoxin reductase (NADPH)
MTFFSTADQLELHNIPFTSTGFRPTRNEAIKYYQGLIRYFNIEVNSGYNVTRVTRSSDAFTLLAAESGDTIRARHVILATGYYDNPNKLDIPGEDMQHVSHYYSEPYRYFGGEVVIVGGKNSAVEAALELYRSGAKVTMVHRREKIEESVKYWILPDLQNRIAEGAIRSYFNAEIVAIHEKAVTILQGGKKQNIPVDAVLLLTGYHPNVQLLRDSGIRFDSGTLVPEVSKDSLESHISGLYIAGSLLAGKNANKIFIENSREHGEIILNHIAAHADT